MAPPDYRHADQAGALRRAVAQPFRGDEEIVGNMIELNRPIEIRLKPEATPWRARKPIAA